MAISINDIEVSKEHTRRHPKEIVLEDDYTDNLGCIIPAGTKILAFLTINYKWIQAINEHGYKYFIEYVPITK